MVKLRRIRIENFTILKEIMGKDSLEINFTDNPICIIIGKNGSGKSFLMGTLSPTSFDLIKNRSGNPAIPDKIGLKELDLELDGKYLYKIKRMPKHPEKSNYHKSIYYIKISQNYSKTL